MVELTLLFLQGVYVASCFITFAALLVTLGQIVRRVNSKWNLLP